MLKEKTALGGAIIAAFIASLCCILPLLFVVLGVSSLGMAAIFEPFRSYMMGSAIVLLALAYYWIYFKADKSTACAPGEECQTKSSNLGSRIGLWSATLAVVLFAFTPYITATLANRVSVKEPEIITSDDDCCPLKSAAKTNGIVSADPQLPANLKRVTFTVTGMSCAACEPAIRIALEKTTGVKRADVSYERGNAIVDFDPNKTTPDKLREVINGTGYKVKE
ncbi:MAG TPA: mercuric transporter MerT family protein [Pyrinomonadaceae bacterium]|nr:mercuric transporter MerT family protein [Pyrinomonadaceae bacterium]